jgi:hypothetical protein
MRRAPTTCGLGIAVALLAAGCGGGGEKALSPSAVADCLRGKNFIVSPADADFVAQANKGFYVTTSGTASQYGLDSQANISFGDVGKLREAYSGFRDDARQDSRSNALVVWDTYNPGSGKILLGCLR